MRLRWEIGPVHVAGGQVPGRLPHRVAWGGPRGTQPGPPSVPFPGHHRERVHVSGLGQFTPKPQLRPVRGGRGEPLAPFFATSQAPSSQTSGTAGEPPSRTVRSHQIPPLCPPTGKKRASRPDPATVPAQLWHRSRLAPWSREHDGTPQHVRPPPARTDTVTPLPREPGAFRTRALNRDGGKCSLLPFLALRFSEAE